MQQDLSESDGKHREFEEPAFYHSYVHGGVSSLVCTVVTFPFYKTVFRQQLHSVLVRQAVAQLYDEGFRKLYRGVVPPLLMKTAQGTVLFGLQHTLLGQLSPRTEPFVPRPVLPALAGLGTGVLEALVFTPFERVQCILQNRGNDRSLPTISAIVNRLRAEPLAHGWYRGFLPVLVRNALGSGLYFGLKDPLVNGLNKQQVPPLASSFVSGMVSSLVISLPLYPLSVLVANMQAEVGGENLGPRACWHKLWQKRQRSLAMLYRGGTLVVLRSCISWGITTAMYDQLMRRKA